MYSDSNNKKVLYFLQKGHPALYGPPSSPHPKTLQNQDFLHHPPKGRLKCIVPNYSAKKQHLRHVTGL